MVKRRGQAERLREREREREREKKKKGGAPEREGKEDKGKNPVKSMGGERERERRRDRRRERRRETERETERRRERERTRACAWSRNSVKYRLDRDYCRNCCIFYEFESGPESAAQHVNSCARSQSKENQAIGECVSEEGLEFLVICCLNSN